MNAFLPIKALKLGDDCRVDLVKHEESERKFVLKSFDREKVMKNGTRIDSVLNESNILKHISGIPQTGPFAEKYTAPKKPFPTQLNRLVTTTKDEN